VVEVLGIHEKAYPLHGAITGQKPGIKQMFRHVVAPQKALANEPIIPET